MLQLKGKDGERWRFPSETEKEELFLCDKITKKWMFKIQIEVKNSMQRIDTSRLAFNETIEQREKNQASGRILCMVIVVVVRKAEIKQM